jgi:hypothetical protein
MKVVVGRRMVVSFGDIIEEQKRRDKKEAAVAGRRAR